MQPKDEGSCRAMLERFYFDKRDGQCKEFIYGGCKGNENNFKDMEECEKQCKGTFLKICTQTPLTRLFSWQKKVTI